MTAEALIAELRDLISRSTDASEEGRILEALRNAEEAAFAEALAGIDTDRLFESVDNRVLGPDHRAGLFALLRERSGTLSVPARAHVIYGLQKGRTGGAAEELIRDLFLEVRGAHLTELKNTINMRIDAHDLEGLIFEDIDDPQVRGALLDHFATQARGAARTEATVLSDIDDTAFARIHETR